MSELLEKEKEHEDNGIDTTDIISDGATWIQIDIMNGQVIDTGICP